MREWLNPKPNPNPNTNPNTLNLNLTLTQTLKSILDRYENGLDPKFLIKILSLSLKTMFTNTAETSAMT